MRVFFGLIIGLRGGGMTGEKWPHPSVDASLNGRKVGFLATEDTEVTEEPLGT
jgi:hypothetical protein